MRTSRLVLIVTDEQEREVNQLANEFQQVFKVAVESIEALKGVEIAVVDARETTEVDRRHRRGEGGRAEKGGKSKGESFNVCQFFIDGQYEWYVRFVDAETAMKKAVHCSTSIGARIGTTVRVIVTDDGDDIAWEWKADEGVVFPPKVTDKEKK